MRVDGSIVGAMSYVLDPSLTQPPRTRPDKRRGRLDQLAEELLEDLDLRQREVRAVDVTHIVLDVESSGQERGTNIPRMRRTTDHPADALAISGDGRDRSVAARCRFHWAGMGDLVNENGFSDHFPITMTHSEAD